MRTWFLIALVLLPGAAAGQDPDYFLRVTDAPGPAGGPAEVAVELDSFGPDLQGWSLGVAHDSGAVSLFDVIEGETTVELDPDFSWVQLFDGGWTSSVVFSAIGHTTLPPGIGYELLRASYIIEAGAGTETDLCFTDTLGMPPVATVLISGGASIVPIQSCGTVTAQERDVRFTILAAVEDDAGGVDSAGPLAAAIESQGEEVLVSGFIPSLASQTARSLWVVLGTFPHNHVLSQTEGQILADLVSMGIPVYVEGNDAWAFDPLTPFTLYDGVDEAKAGNGDDTHIGLVGHDYHGARLAGLDASYSQEHTGDDSTDQLHATSSDLAGPHAGAIWSDDGTGGSPFPYHTGIFYDTAPGFGKVISQSWEFGGYGGDQGLLAQRYLQAFGLLGVADFQRGDTNGDGVVDIADPLFIESELFSGGPTSPCFDASDANDDGLLDIADAISILSYLFVSGPTPPSPGPLTCGDDPTVDALDCAEYESCS